MVALLYNLRLEEMQLLELPFPFPRSVYIRTRGEVCLLSEQNAILSIKGRAMPFHQGIEFPKKGQ